MAHSSCRFCRPVDEWSPLVFSSFGLAGGGLAASLAAYHWPLLGAGAVSLGMSYYLNYWKQPRQSITLNKVVLWVATVVVFLNLFLPILLRHFMG